jgi:tRNA modification GTPase
LPQHLSYGRWTLPDGVLDDPLVRGGDGWFEVNLHGGRRIVEKCLQDAQAAGFTCMEPEVPLITRATTPLGLRLAAVQDRFDPADADPDDLTLVRLLNPPLVAIAGPPNAGKSTLVNRLANRAASLVADEPGTTRDWVEVLAVLCDGQLPIRLADTPGRRATTGVEATAIELSDVVLREADLIVRLLDATRPDQQPAVGRDAIDVWNKSDLHEPSASLAISAATGAGMIRLERGIARSLQVRLDLGERPLLY